MLRVLQDGVDPPHFVASAFAVMGGHYGFEYVTPIGRMVVVFGIDVIDAFCLSVYGYANAFQAVWHESLNSVTKSDFFHCAGVRQV